MATALGLGLEPGTAVVSLGTSGVAMARSPRQTADPTGVVAGFADATGAFLPLVCTLNGARNLAAMASTLGVGLDEFADLAVSALRPAARAWCSCPYLEGERTPPLPDATGELRGVTLAQPDRGQHRPRRRSRACCGAWRTGCGCCAEQASPGRPGHADRRWLPSRRRSADRRRRLRPTGAVTEPYESVAVGAARQAAWALTGTLPDWSVPISGTYVAAARRDRGGRRAGRALSGCPGRGLGAVLNRWD